MTGLTRRTHKILDPERGWVPASFGPAAPAGGPLAAAGAERLAYVYHFMFPTEWDAGSPHCSFWADNPDSW